MMEKSKLKTKIIILTVILFTLILAWILQYQFVEKVINSPLIGLLYFPPVHFGDMNGDTFQDAIYIDTTTQDTVIWSSLSSGNAQASLFLSEKYGIKQAGTVLIHPFQPQKFLYLEESNQPTALEFTTNPLNQLLVYIDFSLGQKTDLPRKWGYFQSSIPEEWRFGDINGDGKVDAVYFDTNLRQSYNDVLVGLNQGDQFSKLDTWHRHGASTPNQLHLGDADGDGKADLLYFDFTRTNNLWVNLSTGNTFSQGTSWESFDKYEKPSSEQLQFGDVNGDGKVDSLYFDIRETKSLWVSLSLENSFQNPEEWLRFDQFGESDPKQLMFHDINKDGRIDAIYFDPAEKNLYVSFSSGDSFSPLFSWQKVSQEIPESFWKCQWPWESGCLF